ncbi:hypothetical protein EVAR_68389_1 [Eumeta japonica]|uniref:Uncharacterized protein n=1 Tax=Eumeta variegata TaxID=151549 RepID=A0A4C2A860_EUMVA|nr:hypothetical protein EVAR_68389_1 [Eumeta japonica]
MYMVRLYEARTDRRAARNRTNTARALTVRRPPARDSPPALITRPGGPASRRRLALLHRRRWSSVGVSRRL